MTIINTLISNSETDILTVPAGQVWASVFLMFCNYSVGDQTITVHVRKSGGAASNTNTVLTEYTVVAKDSCEWDGTKLILDATDVVSAVASAAGAISCTASYVLA
jgi:hypothetical protein